MASCGGQRKNVGCRPLLTEPPLNIENLPSRIQKGDCKVLPPTFCPPTCVPMPPPTSCGMPPCTPYPCYYPPPCTPMCCPPMMYCQPPPCTPYPCCSPSPCCPTQPCCQTPQPCCPPPKCCSPCPPSKCCKPKCCSPCPPPKCCCPPPKCCPPCIPQCGQPKCCPPCPPPCVTKCCTPCGMQGCCGSPKQIVCIPKQVQPCLKKCEDKCKSSGPSFDQPASYNNCNFYLTAMPKGLQDKFGPMLGGRSMGSECEENEERDTCDDAGDQDECCEDPCCDDYVNSAAGDDQCFPPPVGYPCSDRTTWAAGGMAGFPQPFPMPPPTIFRGGSKRNTRGRTQGRPAPRTGRGTAADQCCDTGYQRPARAATNKAAACCDPGYGRSRGAPATAAAYCEPGQGRSGATAGDYNYIGDDPNRNIAWGTDPCLNTDDGVYHHPEDYRDYLYEEQELTKKPDAYLPENYPVPPPHAFNKKIHPLRAPIIPPQPIPTKHHKGIQNHNRGRPLQETGTGTDTDPCLEPPRRPQLSAGTNTNSSRPGTGRTAATQPAHDRRKHAGNQYEPPRPNRNRPAAYADDCIEPPSSAYRNITRGNSAPNLSGYESCGYDTQQYDACLPTSAPQEQCCDMSANAYSDCEAPPPVCCKPKTCKKKTCLQPNTRRLHRLCSFSNRRKYRLSDIAYQPNLKFKKPACPIRETVASILRKKPPAHCDGHDKEVPAFHEYCMTDHCPAPNRYPLLTKVDCDGLPTTANAEKRNRVTKRGAKRKNHHRC